MPESTRQPGEQLVERKPLEMQADGSIKGLGDALKHFGVIGNEEPAPDTDPVPAASEVITKDKSEDPPPAVKKDDAPPNTDADRKLKIKWHGQEIELPEKDLVSLAQQGYDYTKKTQDLAEKERNLAPVEGLAKQIQGDPRFAAYVYQYFNQGGPAQPAAPKPPEDPVERLKYEIRNEIVKELGPQIQQSVQPLTQQSAVQRVQMDVMRDPMFNDVQAKLHEYVNTLPPHSRQMEFMRLDQDPQSYLEMYGHVREQIVRQKAAAPPDPLPPKNGKGEIPPGARREQKAPLLESSGTSEPPATKESQKKERLSKAKAKLLAGGDVGALTDWIRESGISDILKGPSPQ